MDDEVVGNKRRRKMKPRSRWKKYHRPGKGELLTEAELARPLGETPRTIRSWRHKGIIPYLVLGHRSIRYRLDSVLAALSKREIKTMKGLP
jgi:Helix-turn-helix domain